MINNSRISEEDFKFSSECIGKMYQYMSDRIIGQHNLKTALILTVLAGGHLLLESLPGLAKTTAARALADSIGGKFSRIQCTPDLLPGDITGTQIYNQSTARFETLKGPVFANIVLLDEINRSNAKTQSAMLEVMEERQVTIGGVTYPMPDDIFTVIATQNPIEQEGTYPLSEAQTDRFMIKEKISYPTPEEEVTILKLKEQMKKSTAAPVVTTADIAHLQEIANNVYVDDAVRKYIAAIVDATRYPEKVLDKETADYIRIGASPRASIAFLKIAKAYALMNGRSYVIPEDVKVMRHPVLRHRLLLNYAAIVDRMEPETLIDMLVARIPTP